MPAGPLRVALLFGGRSPEHEVSLRSAKSVFEAIDKRKYEPVPILLTRQGAWYRRPAESGSFDDRPTLDEEDRLVASPDPSHGVFLKMSERGRGEAMSVDVVFPVLHGTYGEDGTVQGLLELADIPYVGCGVLASALGMDKVLMKAAFRDAGLEIGPFFWFLRSHWMRDRERIVNRLGGSRFPVFIKPANMGSSVGITRVKDPSGFRAAVDLAATYDRKIVVEDGINGREIEVSVLGNDEPRASAPGEIVSHSEFYDYQEKYLQDTAELMIPANLPAALADAAQSAAVTAFKAVDGAGLARVDMFVTPEGRIIVNEINTLPGFTSISMYPKLWEASGLSYESLVETLIDLALERHRDKQQTATDRRT